MNASKPANAVNIPISLRQIEAVLISAQRLRVQRCLGFAVMALIVFALSPPARAQSNSGNVRLGPRALDDPGLIGDYNTAVGIDALTSDTKGYDNAAFGAFALYFNTEGYHNTAAGTYALQDNATGSANTAIGFATLYRNTVGHRNTATGWASLVYNKTSDNTAFGYATLYSNQTGTQNTAIGGYALYSDNGSYNTATGFEALRSNQDGGFNLANGWQALYSNASGGYNTASGAQALASNTNGSSNTGLGAGALQFNVIGAQNAAVGASALYSNYSGNFNTATGVDSLHSNNTGGGNVADGWEALYQNTTGSYNIALGYKAGFNLTTGSNNIMIGAGVLGAAGDANKIRIGKTTHAATYIGGIYNKAVASASAVAVFVDSSGKLGTIKSSARYKEQIKRMDTASEAILQLEPVTFRYKEELDPHGVTQFGLIAEQVEKANPELVVRDEDGKVSTVRYEAVNAMLLNEFLKAHRKLQEQGETLQKQQATIAKQEQRIAQQQNDFQTKIAQQQKQIEALTTVVRRVSDELERTAFPRQIAATTR